MASKSRSRARLFIHVFTHQWGLPRLKHVQALLFSSSVSYSLFYAVPFLFISFFFVLNHAPHPLSRNLSTERDRENLWAHFVTTSTLPIYTHIGNRHDTRTHQHQTRLPVNIYSRHTDQKKPTKLFSTSDSRSKENLDEITQSSDSLFKSVSIIFFLFFYFFPSSSFPFSMSLSLSPLLVPSFPPFSYSFFLSLSLFLWFSYMPVCPGPPQDFAPG